MEKEKTLIVKSDKTISAGSNQSFMRLPEDVKSSEDKFEDELTFELSENAKILEDKFKDKFEESSLQEPTESKELQKLPSFSEREYNFWDRVSREPTPQRAIDDFRKAMLNENGTFRDDVWEYIPDYFPETYNLLRGYFKQLDETLSGTVSVGRGIGKVITASIIEFIGEDGKFSEEKYNEWFKNNFGHRIKDINQTTDSVEIKRGMFSTGGSCATSFYYVDDKGMKEEIILERINPFIDELATLHTAYHESCHCQQRDDKIELSKERKNILGGGDLDKIAASEAKEKAEFYVSETQANLYGHMCIMLNLLRYYKEREIKETKPITEEEKTEIKNRLLSLSDNDFIRGYNDLPLSSELIDDMFNDPQSYLNKFFLSDGRLNIREIFSYTNEIVRNKAREYQTYLERELTKEENKKSTMADSYKLLCEWVFTDEADKDIEPYHKDFINHIVASKPMLTANETFKIGEAETPRQTIKKMFYYDIISAKDCDDFMDRLSDEKTKRQYEERKKRWELKAIERVTSGRQISPTIKSIIEKDIEENPIERDRKLGIELEPKTSEYVISKLFQHRVQRRSYLDDIKERLKRQAKQDERLKNIVENIHAVALRLVTERNIVSLNDEIDSWGKALKREG
jgi:hypothetical protein